MVLGDSALAAGEAVAPELPDPLPLLEYDSDRRAVGLVERTLRAAAGPDGWDPVARALGDVLLAPASTVNQVALSRVSETFAATLDPNARLLVPRWAVLGQAVVDFVEDVELPRLGFGDPRMEFCQGLVEGTAEALMSAVSEQVRMVQGVVGSAVEFATFVYDVDSVVVILQILTDPSTDPAAELDRYLKSDFPDLWLALVNLRTVLRGVDAIVQALCAEGTDGSGVSRALGAIASWLEEIPETLGGALRPHVDAVVAAQGNPQEQGVIIGRVFGPVVIEIVLTAIDLTHLARGAIRFFAKQGPLLLMNTRDLAAEALDSVRHVARETSQPMELAAALTKVEKVAPDLSEAGTAVASGVLGRLTREWGELGHRIAPYRINSRQTRAWNKAARDLTGLEKKDLEYALSVRLDSNHILEAHWFDKFPDEFKEAFKEWPVLDTNGDPVLEHGQPLVVSWTSAKDMDAFALHTEAHIRSGERMAEQGLLGADKYRPLHNEMTDFFDAYRNENLAGRDFQNLREIFDAHKRFYQGERTSTLWPRLSAWFARADDALTTAGL